MIEFQALGEGRRNQDWLQARRDCGIRAAEVFVHVEDLRILAQHLVVHLVTLQQLAYRRDGGVSNNHPYSALVTHRLSDRLGQLFVDVLGGAQIELAAVSPYRMWWLQCRRDLRQQSGCKVDHRSRHSEPGHQLLDRGIGMAQMRQRFVPGASCPRSRRLCKITEHRDRAGACSTSHGSQHHRGKILGFIEDQMAAARRTLQQVGCLIDQDHVSERPAGRARRPRRTSHYDQLLLICR